MMMIIMMMMQVLTAEICTPTYTTSCGPVSVKGTKLGEREQCVEIRSGGLLRTLSNRFLCSLILSGPIFSTGW